MIPFNRIRSQVLLVCFGALLAIALPSLAEARLFSSSSETRSTDISAFTKWTKVLKRHPPHLKKLEAKCVGNEGCQKKDWDDYLASLKDASKVEQIKKVNSYMNEVPYVRDIVNWGMEDYWATLFEFFTRNGDCEDYAIAKYMSLKKLGFSTHNMRIVVLDDKNLGVLHSVLVVYEGGKRYILDNQIKSVLTDNRIHHYEPIYSINEYAWWRHLP